MRKIIIIPSFASSHLLKCSIPNWIDVIEPDIIIINEGLFPIGPENKGHIDEEFRMKWCENEFLIGGFDFVETLKIIQNCNCDNRIVVAGIMSIESLDANSCFLKAISTFPDNEHFSCEPEVGDIIFPLEPDVLFHQDDKEKIQSLISKLKPGEGIQCVWKDFLQTQFYVEKINESNPKWRRFCYCFDTMKNYRSAMDAFMTQNYSKLKKIDEFIAFHYPWFVSGKWKELRYELIYRADPAYWKNFDIGLEWIKKFSDIFVTRQKLGLKYEEPDPIMIRPSRHDEARWAKFIEIDHPKHIQPHENFIK